MFASPAQEAANHNEVSDNRASRHDAGTAPMKVPRKATNRQSWGKSTASERRDTLCQRSNVRHSGAAARPDSLRALAPGQILEVQADSKEAADGMRAWTRLTEYTSNVEAEAGSRRLFTLSG